MFKADQLKILDNLRLLIGDNHRDAWALICYVVEQF